MHPRDPENQHECIWADSCDSCDQQECPDSINYDGFLDGKKFKVIDCNDKKVKN